MVDLTLGTILAQMLNFFILVWILARFAYKPLVSMATKVVAKDMDSETNTKLIEDAIAKLDSKTIGL